MIRLEALGCAIPNLVQVCELLELSGIAKKMKIKMKEIPVPMSDDDFVLGKQMAHKMQMKLRINMTKTNQFIKETKCFLQNQPKFQNQ